MNILQLLGIAAAAVLLSGCLTGYTGFDGSRYNFGTGYQCFERSYSQNEGKGKVKIRASYECPGHPSRWTHWQPRLPYARCIVTNRNMRTFDRRGSNNSMSYRWTRINMSFTCPA